MKKSLKSILAVLAVVFLLAMISVPAFAANEDAQETTQAVSEAEEAGAESSSSTKTKAITAAGIMAIAATVGAIMMGLVIKGANDNIARQPEASGSIRSTFMLGLVFIETVVIYALIVAILIIFIL